MSFSSLGLSADLLRAVSDKGYSEPTPIQLQAIPVILEGRDIMAGAQTGTGKTAGFTLPLLQRLNAQMPVTGRHALRALILTPTRELAAQVEESVRTYGRHLPLKSTVVFGGVGFNPQADRLRHGVDILVATPGRLLDHVQQKTVDLSHIEILVLDEADRMLDMGFIRDIRRILALLPKQRQNLLFSATYTDEIKQLADGLLHDPALIEVARRSTAAELVSQVAHPVDRARKRELLSHLVHSQGWKQVLVFTRTKHGANRLAEQLEKDGITSAAIHGNKSQGARTKALADFKKNAVRVLVATDIAARGLDINELPHVVNYELPNVPEDYVHRIGRTGRAGNEGEAVSLVCVDERDFLRDIERLLGHEIPKVTIAGFEPDPSIKAEPIFQGRGQRGGGGRPQGGGRHDNSQRHRHSRPQSGPRQNRDGQRGHLPPAPRQDRDSQRNQLPPAPSVHDDEDNRGNRLIDPPQLIGNDRFKDPLPGRGRSHQAPGKPRGPSSHQAQGKPRGPSSHQPRPDSRPGHARRRGRQEVPAVFIGGRRDD